MDPNTLITYDAVNRSDNIPTSRSSFRTRSITRKFRFILPSFDLRKASLSQGVDFPTPYFMFMGRFDSTSGQVAWQTISFATVRGYLPNLSRLEDSHLIRMNRQGLVPRRRGERNSGALSSEPFDMFGLNFQGVKRASVEIGRTENRMIQ
jgi:hypothetical protein